MSTTTTTTVVNGVDLHGFVSAGVSADAVSALTEQGLSIRQAVAVAAVDAGLPRSTFAGRKDKDGTYHAPDSTAWADTFGDTVLVGGFGNLYTQGMRKAGREGELKASTGGGGPVKARTPRELLQDECDRIAAMIDRASTPVDEADKALKALGSKAGKDAIVQRERERIAEAIAALNAEAEAIEADPSAVIDAERERLTARRDAAKDRAGERVEKWREALKATEAALAVLPE